MQITYFIGNGFDLAMGMKTSYRDFIQKYIVDAQSDGFCVKSFKRLICADINTWSAGEVAMGECTSTFSPERYMDFCTCYDDFLVALSNYFKEQDALCGKPIRQRTRKVFKSALFNLSDIDYHQIDKRFLTSICAQIMDERYYCFVNFNYTRAFDNCLREFGERGIVTLKREVAGKPFNDIIGPLIHVHGIHGKAMAMGVNDETQIDNKAFSKIDEVRDRLIKPEINGKIYNAEAFYCNDIIRMSDVIILFGMSIGKTDKIWWSKIGEWLKSDQKHQLLIFSFRPELSETVPGQYIGGVREAQNSFLQNTELPSKDSEKIRPQIHVVINYPLFGSNLYDFQTA